MLGRRGVASIDVAAVATAFVVILAALNAAPVRAALDVPATFSILTLTAAATGAAAALLGVLASRLTGEPRPAWIAAALVLYCIVVLPWSAQPALDTVHRASRLVAYLGALVLLLLSIRPPRMLRTWGSWVIVLVSGLLALATLGGQDSALLHAFVDGPVLTVAVLVGWSTAAAAFVVDGYRRGSRARLRLGLGLVVLAAAQIYRVTIDMPATTDLAFAGLRVLGLVIVVAAFAQLTLRAVGSLESEQWRQQEELSVAAMHMERAREAAAERDHELRNGLAGLAGITHLLSAGSGSAEQRRMRHAVLSELGRLHALLDGSTPPPADPSEDDSYLVEPVLTGLVALRTGGAVTLTVTDGLTARGSSAVLAQVVTNLLANCDRHAPGAPVTITARADRDGVAVEVRDSGPGLAPGTEESVLGRGVRDEQAGGSGLGLHISARLIALQGGSLELRTVTEPVGCLARVVVPSAESVEPFAGAISR